MALRNEVSMGAHTRAPQADVDLRPDIAARMTAQMKEAGIPEGMAADLQVGMLGRCQIIAQREGADLRWHLSISHPFRLPTWGEINAARDALIPADVWLCQPMPPRDYWINVHTHCLHLWQIKDRELIAQWAFDGCQNEMQAEEVAAAAVA